MKKMIILILSIMTFIVFSVGTNAQTIENDFYSYFGMYPQDVVTDEILYDDLYFLSDDYLVEGLDSYYQYLGAYYVKIRTGVFEKETYFNNGTRILENRIYFFKVQPVLWKVYDEKDMVLYSEKILDCDKYYDEIITDISQSEYANSKIKQTLDEMISKLIKTNNFNFAPIPFSLDYSSMYQSGEVVLNNVHLLNVETLNDIQNRKARCTDYALAKSVPWENIDGIIYGEYWSNGCGTNDTYKMYVRPDGEFIYNKKVDQYSGIRLLVRGL